MDNCKCKTLPGWEQFESKAQQEARLKETMGLYNPAEFNPSMQEVSLKDRLASKLDSRQEKEYGMAPVEYPYLSMAVESSRKRRK